MPPSGTSQDIAHLVRPARRLAHVTPHVCPFVKGDTHRVVGTDVLGQAKARGIPPVLGLKCAKQAVPDNERPGVVSVDVARVRAVMDTVMRWGLRQLNFFIDNILFYGIIGQ